MPYKKRIISWILFFLLILIISGKPALAYIDPGTGSYMLQIAIAFLIGALFTVKGFWKKIITFLKTAFFKKKNNSRNDL